MEIYECSSPIVQINEFFHILSWYVSRIFAAEMHVIANSYNVWAITYSTQILDHEELTPRSLKVKLNTSLYLFAEWWIFPVCWLDICCNDNIHNSWHAIQIRGQIRFYADWNINILPNTGQWRWVPIKQIRFGANKRRTWYWQWCMICYYHYYIHYSSSINFKNFYVYYILHNRISAGLFFYCNTAREVVKIYLCLSFSLSLLERIEQISKDTNVASN